jgi:multidrug resistance protein, MATE family
VSTLVAIKKTISYAVPIASASILNMLATFIAMFMVARLGKMPLAAAALASNTFYTMMAVAICSMYVLSILISHARGEDRHDDVGMLVRSSFLVVIVLGVPISWLVWHAAFMLTVFHQDPALIALTVSYFHYAGLSIVPSMLGMMLSQFFTGIGRPRVPMYFTLCMLPCIVLLSYLLIFGHAGFPAMGLAGAGAAMFWVELAFALCVVFFLPLTASAKKYRLFVCDRLFDWALFKKILGFGLPIGIQFGGEIAAMTLVTYFLGYYGVAALAATQVVSQYSIFVVMMVIGVSQAVAVLVSEAYGQKNEQMIRAYVRGASYCLLLFFIVVLIFFVGFPSLLLRFFIGTDIAHAAQILRLGRYFFYVATLYLFIDAFRNMLAGALRGLHDSITPMVIGLACLWVVSVPLTYWVGVHLLAGSVLLRLTFVTGVAVAVVILIIRLLARLKCLDVAQNSLKKA